MIPNSFGQPVQTGFLIQICLQSWEGIKRLQATAWRSNKDLAQSADKPERIRSLEGPPWRQLENGTSVLTGVSNYGEDVDNNVVRTY
ncbi:hypothetical protein Zmor_010281 [Zophobas morio]|uniref:Uncharacterized protein n=1 Tax=Zophobas morio TaxID=2755281 RepID=A0AA38IK20_9CUCU|nr:hypothetical protein Zmor_010281 [Zophobas morio]